MKKFVFGAFGFGLAALLSAIFVVTGEARGKAGTSTSTAPPIRVLKGYGKRVLAVTIVRNSPIVVTGSHSGTSNFIVHLVGNGNTEFIFNEIGRFSGQALVEEGAEGHYRVVVNADGSWTLTFAQPQPTASAKLLPGVLTGRGKRVLAVRTASRIQPIVTAVHTGTSNFIVHLVGYGNNLGVTEFLFNEIGKFRGQTLVEDELAPGGYLVSVDADGAWSLRFTR